MQTVEVEKPIYVEKMVEKPVYIDRIVEKVVEKPVYVDRVVEKMVHVENRDEIGQLNIRIRDIEGRY